MELEEAIKLLKRAVKYPGTIDQKHIDLTIIPVEEHAKFEQAMQVSQASIKEGKMSREEFNRRVGLN